jgi:hypothetical protein
MSLSPLNSATKTSTKTGAQTSAQATSSTSPVALAMQKANARLQPQLETASAQLSSFGKLKASIADMQVAAHAMSGLTSASSAADAKAAAIRFVTSFNASTVAAKTAATAMASSDPSVARRVGNDLSRSVTANYSAFDALKKIGFKQQPDGSLALDAAKLDAALSTDPAGARASLAKLGQTADTLANRELAEGGNVAAPWASLNQRSTALKTQQNAILAIEQKLNATTSTQSTPSSSYVNYGIAAYKSGV